MCMNIPVFVQGQKEALLAQYTVYSIQYTVYPLKVCVFSNCVRNNTYNAHDTQHGYVGSTERYPVGGCWSFKAFDPTFNSRSAVPITLCTQNTQATDPGSYLHHAYHRNDTTISDAVISALGLLICRFKLITPRYFVRRRIRLAWQSTS